MTRWVGKMWSEKLIRQLSPISFYYTEGYTVYRYNLDTLGFVPTHFDVAILSRSWRPEFPAYLTLPLGA